MTSIEPHIIFMLM